MRIITQSLDQISGMDLLATGSLLVFFLLFLWIVYRIYRTSKSDAEKWGKLPLEFDEQSGSINKNDLSNNN